MSKISLTPNASGTGNFTIASPATNTDRTLTLPDNTGTILTSASNTNFPAGSVLQVVQGTLSTTPTTNSTTFVTTGLSATITPKSSTNKILIIANGSYYSTSTSYTYYTIYRGSTNLEINSTRGFAEANFAANTGGIMAVSYLDSPATTSATTYTIYTRQGALVYFPVDGSTAAITLMEIAA